MIEIPLTSSPKQIFSISVNSVKYNVTIMYNSRLALWTIGLAIGSVDIVNGVALLGGVDIFKQYRIGIKNAYVVNLANNKVKAGSDNLGTDVKLFVLTDEEIDSVQTV